ncbi:hypothetical protein [Rhizobium sp. Nf11,1]|uniref:hypothetical protein n=1 Tax=Rhizobium sp. Nf11,1 TaxID=3404923 RepID=UPI003D331F4F
MTTTDDAQQNQEQQNAVAETGEANEGWTSTGYEQEGQEGESQTAADGEEGDNGEQGEPAGAGEGEAEAEPKPLSAEDNLKAEVKKYRDRFSATKGEAEALRKLARKMEDEGLLDRKEIAEELEIDPAYLDAVLDKKELPEPGDIAHVNVLHERFKEDYANPVIQKALERAYGDQKAREEILKAFDYAVANDEDLRNRYMNTQPDDVLYFAMDEGKAALDEFRAVEAIGSSPRKMLARIRELESENETLRNRPAANVNTQEQEPASREVREEQPILDPLKEREQRLRALRN